MTQELAILTPEKAIVGYRLAGIGSRAIAQFFDWFIIAALDFAVIMFIAQLGGDPSIEGIVIITILLGWMAYFIFLEGLWNGQTPGKKIMGLRVRMADGTAITFLAAMGRNFLRFADFIPAGYLLGLMSIYTSPKSQRIGDFAAGTIVISERRAEPRFQPAPYVLGTHPMEHLVGDLRGMTQEEYVALKQLCDRMPELSSSVQEKLLRDIWRPIAQRRGVIIPNDIHPIFLAEATVMKFGREKGLL